MPDTGMSIKSMLYLAVGFQYGSWWYPPGVDFGLGGEVNCACVGFVVGGVDSDFGGAASYPFRDRRCEELVDEPLQVDVGTAGGEGAVF